MEVQGGTPSTVKRRNGPHVDWNDEQVVAILRKMEEDKSIKWEEGCEMVKRITGSNISTMTLRRQLAKAQQRASIEGSQPEGSNSSKGTAKFEELRFFDGLSITYICI
ncbi:unnamed protein product [Toxocara canis]|uniref:SANT domain-containing protein n=1 Tax=Toxocara canis TaxID=6265 RepID=A0A183V267_TOXCA|nr:unnamed protein product [Toxocara canis]